MKNMIVAGCLITFLSACATQPDTRGIGTEKLVKGDQAQAHLVIDNPKLAKKLKIKDVQSRSQNAFLEVNLELASLYNKDQNLQYQFSWYDQQGFAIEARKSYWQPVTLHGHQVISLRASAPHTNATQFKLYVREVPKKAYKY